MIKIEGHEENIKNYLGPKLFLYFLHCFYINVEALPLLVLINHGGTVLLEHVLAQLLLLGEAGLLHVGDTLVHVGQLLHGVAVILAGRLVHLVRGVVLGIYGCVHVATSALTQGLDIKGPSKRCREQNEENTQHDGR